jgi:hypothetical protein
MAETPQPLPFDDNLQKTLDFARGQVAAEIQNIERLFNRAKTMFGWLLWAASALVVFFGVSTYIGLENLVTKLVNDEMKRQVPARIEQQLTKEKIEATIRDILRRKTQAEFQGAISNAVLAEVNTPSRQTFFQKEIKRQVDALAKDLAGEYEVKINGVPAQSLTIAKKTSR